MRIPVSGGVPQLVLEMRNRIHYGCARAPASLCVVLEASEDEKHLTVTAFDPLKGRGKVLRTIDRDPSVNYYVAGVISRRIDFCAFASRRTGDSHSLAVTFGRLRPRNYNERCAEPLL
jgi:hypothetical protein